jgi:parallel beta-helix repeat protein
MLFLRLNYIGLGKRIELLRKTVSGIILTVLLTSMLTLAFNIQPAKADQELQILLETDKDTYILGKNVTIVLANIDIETVQIGGYPAWQICTYPEEQPVYPAIFAFLAWSLNLGENDTFVWNQYNQFNETFCSSGTYVVKDTQGWGLSAYFKIISANIIVPDDYPTIQEAVNAASPGDIIYVYGPDYYEENVIVDKSVSLIGIFGPGLGSFNVVADNVYIKGFGFSSPWGFPYGNVIVLNGVSGCEISNVIVSDIDESSGIVLTNASNNIIANSWGWGLIWGGGIVFQTSSNNTIFGNTLEAYYGPSIYLDDSSDNKFFHNQFYVYEARQVEVIGRSKNVWDDGYPSGGNYWSDYNGTDLFNGLNQNETGSDGIGDTAYVIDADNTDNYPLMKPYAGLYDIGITNITPSKTVVGQDYNLTISMKILNYGINTETFNLTVYANKTAIQTITNIVLTSRNSTTITFTWNTTGFAKGNYTIWAYAWPVPDETDTTDNTVIDGWVIVTIPGDVNGDHLVDISDLVMTVNAIPSAPGWSNWNTDTDINNDGLCDVGDLVICVGNIPSSW